MKDMKSIRNLIPVIVFLCAGIMEGFSQQNLSNRGREFWVGYGHHQFMEPGQSNSQEMVLYFSAEQAANVTVTVRGRTATQVTNYFVPANSVIASNFMPKSGALDSRLYDVPPTFGGNGGEGVFNMSIHIESDVPVVAYAHTFGSASSGATMLMPVETYGFAYISLNSRQMYANNCFSWAYCIATHDNTVVEIIPSVQTRLNKPANIPFTVTLNKGQIFQVIGANPTNSSTALELSGTKFKSIANAAGDCYPIAVFSGSSRTYNAISCGSGGGDNDNQQCFPTQAWGKRYLTAPTSRSTAANQFMTNSYKVLVKDPATVVTRNGVPLTGLQANSYYFFESTTADLIQADKPVMVAQYMTGGSCLGGGVGDPEMIYISPVEQGIKKVGFYRNTRESIQVNYLTLIIPNNGLASLRIDGSATFDHSYPHPQAAGYTVVVKRWTAAQSQAIAYSDSAFTAITYGLGSVESYGYNAGTLINNLGALPALQNVLDPATSQHPYTCKGTPVKLSVLMAYQPTRLDWRLSLLGNVITPNTDVIDNAPVSAGTVVVNGVPYFKYTLPGNYVFNAADTFTLPINSYNPGIENCYGRDSLGISFIVKEKPVADFSFSHSGCTLDPVTFTGTANTSNGYSIRDYNWTFPGSVNATGSPVIQTLPPGTHIIGLNVVSTEGCSSDTTKQITVYDRPPADFMVTPAALCEGSAFTITDTSSASVTVNSWYWDFGNTVTQTVGTGPTVNYTYPAAGTYTIKHVAKSSATCVSDTVSRVVTVYARPQVNFANDAAGCLSPAGLVQFTGNASVTDAQAISTWDWNFGDPNATTGNPNTSALQHPSHNYQQGTYTISLTATTANGCASTQTQNVTFNLKPAFSFPALQAVCENQPALSVATAQVTNGVTGTGVYTGPGTDVTGQFNPAQAGYGTHTIWYKFTSAAGCIDSVAQTILVHARPRTQFTIPASTCLPSSGLVSFTNTSTIPDGQPLSWSWNFGDPNASGTNPNTSVLQNPSHNYGEGNFTIQLTATTANGCVKDTSITTAFAVTPALNFPPLVNVCENPGAAPASVASATVLNAVTGTGLYSGTGVNAAGLFDANTAGPGVHTVMYTFTTTGGCSASASATIEVYPMPDASFTATNNGNVCDGDAITFTSTSAVPTGSITNWNWSFGNGNTASATNGNPVTVNYTGVNSYNVQLITVSDRGCFSQPATQTVFVRPDPVADFTLPSGICMPGGAAVFTNNSSVADNSTLGYSWNFGDGNSSAATNPSHIYTSISNYTVSLLTTTPYGCTAQVTKSLSGFLEKPVAAFSVNRQELCQGTDNVFTDASTALNSTIQSWAWNFADGSTSAVANPVKRFSTPGTYAIRLVVTNAAGCLSDPFELPVTVHLQPVIEAGPDLVLPQGDTLILTASANSGNLAFNWSPGFGLSSNTILNPKLTALADQIYILTATGDFGCTAQDQFTLKILKPVHVPNAFSPNGDNIHDQWLIPNLGDYPGCTVEVFNRYGQQVFYAAGYSTPWNGTYQGKTLPAGTYYYVIRLQNGFKPMSGSVTLIR